MKTAFSDVGPFSPFLLRVVVSVGSCVNLCRYGGLVVCVALSRLHGLCVSGLLLRHVLCSLFLSMCSVLGV